MTEEEDRVANADQNNLLHRAFDPVMTEPIPACSSVATAKAANPCLTLCIRLRIPPGPLIW